MIANDDRGMPFQILRGISCVIVCATAVQAAAQSTLELPRLTIPAESQNSASDIQVSKTATETGFEISVSNHGTDTVTGIVVSERIGRGRPCSAGNPVTIAASVVPKGRFKIADLTGAGIKLSALSGDQVVILTYSCGVS